MAELNVSDLDFDTIKQNLKTFLRSQTEFQDYDFDGAALSVLIDLLAYNTHYNATLAHMVANEMFIDSAVKRNSVVSIAKTMGYTPRSIASARSKINFVVQPDPSYMDTSLVLETSVPFRATVDNKTYTFYPLEGQEGLYRNNRFYFNNVELIEGTRLTNSFVIDQTNLSGPLIIPNKNVDSSSIRIRVRENPTDTTVRNFTFSDNVVVADDNRNVFYLQENSYGLLEIRFGDGIVSNKLAYGNIVYVDYIVSSGDAANGISSFSINQTLTGSGEVKTITSVDSASGGNKAETINEIRANAPLFNATKNRAVTSVDYETLIKAKFPNIDSVMVWGGEENSPPIYGKVFVSINPLPNSIITEEEKDNILYNIIKPRSVVSIQPEFVEPLYNKIRLVVSIKYDKTQTAVSSSTIQNEAIIRIQDYFKNNLSSLGKNFYYSDFTRMLQNITPSIYSVSTQIQVSRNLPTFIGAENRFEEFLNMRVEPESLRSAYFVTTIGAKDYQVYLTDNIEGSSESVPGDIIARTTSGTNGDQILITKVGTIDYSTGRISIPSIHIKNLSGTQDQLRLYVTPYGQSPNLLTSELVSSVSTGSGAIFPLPSRNIVLTLDESSADTLAAVSRGITVTATPTNGRN